MFSLCVCKRTKGMLVFISLDNTASVVSQFACTPGADTRDTNTAAVCFMLYHILDTVLPPHLETLFLATFSLLATEIQVLKNDTVHGIQYGLFSDGRGNLLCHLIIDAPCVLPE